MNYKEKLIKKLQDQTAIIGIIGLGYVGLPIVRTLCNKNIEVIGFDIDQHRVDSLNQGKSYIEDALSNNALQEFNKQNLFRATNDFTEFNKVDALIICVPTPLDKYQQPNLSYVKNTISAIAEHHKKGQVISLESTTFPGTTEEILVTRLEQIGLNIGDDFFVVYSPERENPGSKEFDVENIPKLVSGHSKNCLVIAQELYKLLVKHPISVSSPKVAEMAKLLENIHRAVNISLVNEMKMIADKMDIDMFEVIDAAKTKPFGFVPYYPGPGIGGHCIPVDPFYLTWKAKEYGIHSRFIEIAGEMNFRAQNYVVERLIYALNKFAKPLSKSKILIMGLAYKKNVADLRESPAIKIIEKILNHNAKVSYYDNFIADAMHLKNKITREKSLENIHKFDAVVIITNHDYIDYQEIKENAQLIIDTRGIYKEKSNKIIRA